MVWHRIQADRCRGRAYQPTFVPRHVVRSWLGVGCVGLLGTTPWSMGLAVGLTIAMGQQQRCLHPPAGAVALLGVLLQAKPGFVLVPMLLGSVLLTLMAVLFSRLVQSGEPYPHHWF